MIYLIGNTDKQIAKIGFTNNDVRHRLSQLQTSNAYKLEVLSTIEGAIELEKSIHALFGDYRIQGEWFKLDISIAEYFNKRTTTTRVFINKPTDITVDMEAFEYLINNLNNTEIGNVMKLSSMAKGVMNVVSTDDDKPHTVDSLRIELDYSINQFKNLLTKLFKKNIIYLLKIYDKELRRTNTVILLNPHLSRNKKAYHIDCLKYFESL